MAVDRGLQIDFADTLQAADDEGVDGDEASGARGFDMALAELGAEALQHSGLLLAELDRALGGGLAEAQIDRLHAIAAPADNV